MSLSSNEKLSSLSQDEDDSGRDSVDDPQTALDDRERINHLETAVAWIRGEVNDLKEYDKDILKDLSKIWQSVREIRDTHKEVKNEQKIQFLEDTELSPPTSPHSTTPSPEPYLASDGQRYRTGTLELLSKAPFHLKRKKDEKILEEYLVSDHASKSEFKVNVSGEDKTDSPDDKLGDVQLRRNGENKLKIPVNPNSGNIDRNRMSYDVASEMEQLRARIQERARMELEDLDKKFSPKLTHPGFGLISSSSHSRQGSLDSSMPSTDLPSNPPVGQVRHSRQASLPVFFDPELVKKSSPPQLLQSNALMEHHSQNDGDSRSPTPPLNYAHVRQASAGSSSSMGSGTFSPPLVVTTQPGHVTHHVISQSAQQIKSYGTPPQIRSPQRNIPQSQNLRPQSGKLPSQPRDSHIHHAHSYSNPVSHTNPLPSQFSKTGPGYSTTTIRGIKRTSPDGSKHQSNGYSKPPLPSSHPPQMSRGAFDSDQSEKKSSSRVSQLRKAPSGEKVAASPRMGRVPQSSGQAPPPHSHQKLGMRLSEPGNMTNFVTNGNGAQVHPEDIQPYMTSNEVKGQMYKYTPYTDNIAKEKSKSLGSSSNSQNRPKANLLPNEQTWC